METGALGTIVKAYGFSAHKYNECFFMQQIARTWFGGRDIKNDNEYSFNLGTGKRLN